MMLFGMAAGLLCPPMACLWIVNRYAGQHALRWLIAAIVLIAAEQNTCECFKAYFPMTGLKLRLPINEKSQSIFSKIPIGQFQVLSTRDNSVSSEFIYSLEENPMWAINATTGEVFMKDDYHKFSNETSKHLITAISKNVLQPIEFPHMTLEFSPIDEEEFCRDLQNICFWPSAHYHIMEDYSGPNYTHVARKVGSLVPRGAKYLCPSSDVKYSISAKTNHFNLKDNAIFVANSLDHESLNGSDARNLRLPIKCQVKQGTQQHEFERVLTVKVGDRNDNGPMLQNNGTFHFDLDDPHFKENHTIGTKIIFLDKDTVAANSHLTYKIHNDTNNLMRFACNAYEADHTGPRNSIISCQLIFARNGLLSEAQYCFWLEATDPTVDEHVPNAARANICLHTDPKKIHEADRPYAMALRHNRKMSQMVTPSESLEDESSARLKLTRTVYNTYPKDVYVYRTAKMYSRVTNPTPLNEIIQMPEVRYTLVEDRTGAFGLTPVGGILYVKDPVALNRSLETVYFLNVSWTDTYQRSFVINVHLINGTLANTTCEFKIKSRSQTCSQVKYQKHCESFCGLATNGGSCQWRGTNDAMFNTKYASCVPNTTYCPDNVCDPLEDLNAYICPQDCVASNRIMGPHSANGNNRGIYSASGTCTCEDNGKCSCAPLDSDEPKQKRKRTKTAKTEQNAAMYEKTPLVGEKSVTDGGISVAGFVCGKSCMIVGITSPVVLMVLLVGLIVSRRNYKHKSLGKASLKNEKGCGNGGGGDCDAANGDLPLIPLENGFKFEAVDSVWEFDREKLVLDVVLGEGEFGKVVKGYATDIGGISGVTTVAVKMLKNGANSVEYMALLSEFQLLQEVSHPNVIKLLGACTKGDSPMIIIEYARYGSLRSYLRLSRKIECAGVDFTDGIEPVNVKNILTFAWQICKGMAYLTEIKLVHRDLAARNVLLADGKICKVSDFGLTRDVYEDDAYLKRSRDRVPVKWMAPESLADHVYTTKSDVWAFGVLCWELITLGASPYPGVPPQNLYHLLKSGYRMERPENTSEEIYAIIRSCWIDDPNARPSFKYLASQFEKLLGNNAKLIEMETNAISNPLYCSNDMDSKDEIERTKLAMDVGTPESLEHLWRPPKMSYDLPDCSNSREFSSTFSAEFLPPPGYDLPRPLIDADTTEQALRYENDLRFPLNIRKSIGDATHAASPSFRGAHYAVPVKRGKSYIDMTNKTHIPDNLDNDFEKHLTKTISFRFSSLLNLQEHDQEQSVVV